MERETELRNYRYLCAGLGVGFMLAWMVFAPRSYAGYGMLPLLAAVGLYRLLAWHVWRRR